MERKLDEVMARVIRLETAEEYRHQVLAWHLQTLHARLDQQHGQWAGWLKIPLALALPIAVFLLMLAITGDWHRALNSAAKIAG